jgi:hypothetical protein
VESTINFFEKTENLQLFYGRAGAKQTMFNTSEIKFEAESSRWNSRLIHYRVPSRQWAISQEPMKPVSSQVTKHVKGNTLFYVFQSIGNPGKMLR